MKTKPLAEKATMHINFSCGHTKILISNGPKNSFTQYYNPRLCDECRGMKDGAIR